MNMTFDDVLGLLMLVLEKTGPIDIPIEHTRDGRANGLLAKFDKPKDGDTLTLRVVPMDPDNPADNLVRLGGVEVPLTTDSTTIIVLDEDDDYYEEDCD